MLPSGIVEGHAYTVTGVAKVLYVFLDTFDTRSWKLMYCPITPFPKLSFLILKFSVLLDDNNGNNSHSA